MKVIEPSQSLTSLTSGGPHQAAAFVLVALGLN
jgi:hypothetical protein